MSGFAPGADAPRWSRQRWFWLVVALLAAHGGLVFWFGERAEPVGVITSPEPILKVMVAPPTIPSFIQSPLVSDPTLFALPSHRGFSGAAWLESSPVWAAPPPWTEPPRWLPPQTNRLGAGIFRFIATNRNTGPFLERALSTPLNTADVLLFGDVVATQSLVRILGPLTNRPLAAPLTVPNPICPDVLADTVIQVRFNRDGLNESAIVVQGSGVKEVDEAALAVAQSAHFVPVVGRPAERNKSPTFPAWGRMVFQWFTLPAPATNLTALNLSL